MPRNLTDLTGQWFGSLVAVSVKTGGYRPVWLCRCVCGGSAFATNGELRAGRKTSCVACSKVRARQPRGRGSDCQNYKHGGASRGAHTKEYRAWAAIIRRCTLPSQRNFPLYGGRGVTVCDEWRRNFSAFLEHIGKAPSNAHSVDRIDPFGNYEPGNVRWATASEQANNKRNSVWRRALAHPNALVSAPDQPQ